MNLSLRKSQERMKDSFCKSVKRQSKKSRSPGEDSLNKAKEFSLKYGLKRERDG